MPTFRAASIDELLSILASEKEKDGDLQIIFSIRDNSPPPKGKRRVTNRIIQEIRNALTALSQRRLETRESTKKVVRLLREHFDDAWKIFSDLQNGIIAEHPVPEGWESESLPVGVMEARQKEINELLEDTQDIPEIPKDLMIQDKDLPKLIKGEMGDANQSGVGDIIHKLHFVYGGWPEQEKVKDGEDGSEKVEE